MDSTIYFAFQTSSSDMISIDLKVNGLVHSVYVLPVYGRYENAKDSKNLFNLSGEQA